MELPADMPDDYGTSPMQTILTIPGSKYLHTITICSIIFNNCPQAKQTAKGALPNMETPIALIDHYDISKDRVILTEPQLKIPGLSMFGRQMIKSALSPLVPHYHPNRFELTFVLKGTITFSVNDADYHLKGGDIFLTFPNEIHSTNLNPISICQLIWFQIDVSILDHFLFLDQDTATLLVSRLYALPSRILSMTPAMVQLTEDAFQNAHLKSSPQLTAAYLALILQLLTNRMDSVEIPVTPDIQQSLDYILAHLSQQISLEQLAGLCHLSVSAYKQKFKCQMGITPRNYINMQKIEYSKQLLNSGYTITETAMQLGFDTSNYFSTVFKKYAFVTPSEYLKKHNSSRNL